MQTLYAIETMEVAPVTGQPEKMLKQKMEESKQLFTYLIYFLTEVARYAETDARNRSGKHLPSQEDLNVNTKIAGNEILWKILEAPGFRSSVDQYHFSEMINNDLLKKIYTELTSADIYLDYIETLSREKKPERKILEYIFSQLMLPNEDFIQHIEENFINWDDDAELMETLVLSYLGKPPLQAFTEILSSDKWQYAIGLLQTVADKKEYTLELIKPKLKNWDADRIAALDLIILQMGVCELLYFETIPTKVTINEYIDIAKAYSTPQSGQFINGLLDNLNKELTIANKIQKKVFKNSTL